MSIKQMLILPLAFLNLSNASAKDLGTLIIEGSALEHCVTNTRLLEEGIIGVRHNISDNFHAGDGQDYHQISLNGLKESYAVGDNMRFSLNLSYNTVLRDFYIGMKGGFGMKNVLAFITDSSQESTYGLMETDVQEPRSLAMTYEWNIPETLPSGTYFFHICMTRKTRILENVEPIGVKKSFDIE